MRKVLFFCFAILSSCWVPEQPPLTQSEKDYFKELKSQWHCHIEREMVPANNSNGNIVKLEKPHYYIELDSLPCYLIDEKDSLKHVSRAMAEKLHLDVINEGHFGYNYKEITIMFICSTGINQTHSIFFTYNTDSL